MATLSIKYNKTVKDIALSNPQITFEILKKKVKYNKLDNYYLDTSDDGLTSFTLIRE
jgi:hypothetical protein